MPVRCPASFSAAARALLSQAGADPAGELDRGRIGGAQLDGVLAPGDQELLGGPGLPAQPDGRSGGILGGRGEGHVAEQGAQQALAVLVAGGRGGPQGGQVGDGSRQLVGAGELGPGGRLGGQRGLGLGEVGEPGLPPGLQAAGDQPVLRLAGQEGALGAVSLVAGTLDGELGGPHRPLAPVGDLVGRGQRQGHLRGLDRRQQRGGDRGRWCRRGPTRTAAWRRGRRGSGSIRSAAAVLVADLHRAAAGAAEHDALAQRGAFPRRAGPGVGPVGGQLRLVGQVFLAGDVARVMAGDQHLPLVAGQLGDRGVH